MTTMPRETWTDERLDDLKDGMHREFDQVHSEIREISSRIEGLSDSLNARFDAMHRTMIAGALAVVAAIIAAGIF